MAEKTTVDGVGPVASQLKEKYSSLERIQLSAIKNLGGAVTQRPGAGGGDVSQTVTRINPTQKSAMEIGANIAAKLERSGAVIRTAEKSLTGAINSTVYDKIPLAQRARKQIPDLNEAKNRVPNPYPKSIQEKIKERKDVLLGEEDYQYNGIVYPPDLLAQSPAHIELEFLNYKRSAPFGKGEISSKSIFKLPLPDNLSVYHSVRFEERDTGMLGELAQTGSAATAISNAQNELNKKLGDMEISNLVSGITSDGLAEDAAKVAKHAAFTTLVESDPVLGGLAGTIAGTIPNPHPTVFFKGVDLRQFEWTWHFVPRSEIEAATLGVVLKQLKKHILPKNSGTFMDYPDLLQPRVAPNDEGWGKFRRCAVKNLSINFTGEGTSAFFVNGKPVSVRCQMSFQEVEAFINQSEEG